MTENKRRLIKTIRDNLRIDILEDVITISPYNRTITIGIFGNNDAVTPVTLSNDMIYKLEIEGLINS
jgi:hypothetical protein